MGSEISTFLPGVPTDLGCFSLSAKKMFSLVENNRIPGHINHCERKFHTDASRGKI